FGTQPATGVLVESELTIRAVTPPGTVGAVDVKVINPDERTGVLPQGYRYVTDVAAPVFTTAPWVAGQTLTGTPGAETATAEIRWQTDEPATSVVDYRPAGDPTYQRHRPRCCRSPSSRSPPTVP
ncbi:MAG: hypothetical protein GY856_37195, partial [bacterium]|nr:hypothetical protein [bacterium]